MIKAKIVDYWSSKIVELVLVYEDLTYLSKENIRKGNLHPILKHKVQSILDITRILMRLRIVTGTYIL